MSIATVTPDHVEKAVHAVLWELLTVIEPLFGPVATARLLGLTEEESESWPGYGQVPTEKRDLARLSEGVGHYAATLGTYVWGGVGGLHSENTFPEVHLLGQVVEAMAEKVVFDTDRGGWFGTASPLIGDNKATDIVKWVVAGYIARARIDWLGGDITIEELAALARVSEKTLRMAANPKNDGALKISKRSHRTVITVDDAMEWLARRPDFMPTRNDNLSTQRDIHMGGTASQFRKYIVYLNSSSPDIREAAKKSGLSDERITVLLEGEISSKNFDFEPDELLRVAGAMGIETPNSFARWVLELQHQERVGRMEASLRQQVLRLSASEAHGNAP
ncbi:MAG: helix-turn-helix domain-containing protein [Lysobacteraceae bacterium]